jgi:hypothetical protein
MKRIILIGLILMSFFQTVSAQKPASLIYFRIGGSFFVSWKNDFKAFYIPAVTVVPGFRLIQSKDFALTISAPVSIGPSFKVFEKSYWGVDLPALMELHIGSSAGNSGTSNIGFMLGAGVAYHYAGKYKEDDSYIYNNGIGNILVDELSFAGYRFIAGISFGKNKSGDRGLITATFGKDFDHEKDFVTGIGIAFILGNRKTHEE